MKPLKLSATVALVVGIIVSLTAFSSSIEFARGTFRTVYTEGHRPHVLSEPPIGRCIPLYTPVDVYRVSNVTDANALVFDNEGCVPNNNSRRLAPNESAEGVPFQAVMFYRA